MSAAQLDKISRLLALIEPEEVHHGDCVGADAEVHAVCAELGLHVVLHPPLNDTLRAWCAGEHVLRSLRPQPYDTRNLRIVRDVQLLLAAPAIAEYANVRSGTGHAIATARNLRVARLVVLPDGAVVT